MHETSSSISKKLIAIDDFTNKKSTINGVETSYQPNSLQRKHPLTITAVLKNNQTAQGLLEEAKKHQDELNAKLAAIASQLAELSLDEYRNERTNQVMVTTFEIAYSLTNYNKQMLEVSELSVAQVALLASVQAFHDHFSEADIKAIKSTLTPTLLKTKITATANSHKFTSECDPMEEPTVPTEDTQIGDPDKQTILYLSSILGPVIRQISIDAWKNIKADAMRKKNDAELDVLFSNLKTEESNEALEKAMEVDGDNALNNTMQQVAQEVFNRNKRKEEAKARKKSSARGKETQPRTAESGHNSKERGRKNSRGSSKTRSDTSRSRSISNPRSIGLGLGFIYNIYNIYNLWSLNNVFYLINVEYYLWLKSSCLL